MIYERDAILIEMRYEKRRYTDRDDIRKRDAILIEMRYEKRRYTDRDDIRKEMLY